MTHTASAIFPADLFPAGVIDAHTHLPLDEPLTQALIESLHLRLFNICVASSELGGLDAQRGWYRNLVETRPELFGWCTSFGLEKFGQNGFAQAAIAQLDADFSAGATACKVWKNIGMDLRDPATGDFVLIDDPRFEPIFAHLAQAKIPLLMHIGEPLACWRPLDERSPHFSYYRDNPQWHWHARADVPSHEHLMAVRDRIIERHPTLTVIGAHYATHEYDFAELARRFDRYPNFRVDTSARLADAALLAARDYPATRSFFIHHADRILWGIDWVLSRPPSTVSEDRRKNLAVGLRQRYELEWRFFATDDEMTINGNIVRGLALPADALRKIFFENAAETYFRRPNCASFSR